MVTVVAGKSSLMVFGNGVAWEDILEDDGKGVKTLIYNWCGSYKVNRILPVIEDDALCVRITSILDTPLLISGSYKAMPKRNEGLYRRSIVKLRLQTSFGSRGR